MKRELSFGFYLLFGILATFGGWLFVAQFFLRAWGINVTLLDFLYEYSVLNLLIMFCMLGASVISMAAAGPYFIIEAVREYRKEAEA
jgi:hypothetical protein